MASIKQFDHVGITVADLDKATAFFVDLGLEIEGRTFLEGEFVDVVTGIPDSRTEIVFLRAPGGGPGVELATFIRPDHTPGSPNAMATELGLRNICFQVEGLQAMVDRLAADGYGLVGGVGQYENTWVMAHVRGPGHGEQGQRPSLRALVRRTRRGRARRHGSEGPGRAQVDWPELAERRAVAGSTWQERAQRGRDTAHGLRPLRLREPRRPRGTRGAIRSQWETHQRADWRVGAAYGEAYETAVKELKKRR